MTWAEAERDAKAYRGRIIEALATLLRAANDLAPEDNPDKYDPWRALVMRARAEYDALRTLALPADAQEATPAAPGWRAGWEACRTQMVEATKRHADMVGVKGGGTNEGACAVIAVLWLASMMKDATPVPAPATAEAPPTVPGLGLGKRPAESVPGPAGATEAGTRALTHIAAPPLFNRDGSRTCWSAYNWCAEHGRPRSQCDMRAAASATPGPLHAEGEREAVTNSEWQIALRWPPCPFCGAVAGDPCRTLTTKRVSQFVHAPRHAAAVCPACEGYGTDLTGATCPMCNGGMLRPLALRPPAPAAPSPAEGRATPEPEGSKT